MLDWVHWARRYLADWEHTQVTDERTRSAIEELRHALRAADEALPPAPAA